MEFNSIQEEKSELKPASRIEWLEDQAAIMRIKYASCSIADSFINRSGNLDDLRPLVSNDYRWQCQLFESARGLEAYKQFLSKYAELVPLSVHLLSNPIIDVDSSRARARGRWVVWQPFTWRNTAWILAGRSDDQFIHGEHGWLVAGTRIEVEILAPWSDAWGRERISKQWSWN